MAHIQARRLNQPLSLSPLFYKLDVQPNIITLDVYERVTPRVLTGELRGEVSNEDMLPDGSTAEFKSTEARRIYAPSIVHYSRGRTIVDGATLRADLAGVKMSLIGTSNLYAGLVFEEYRTNMGSWEVADASVYGLFVDRSGHPLPAICVSEDHANRKAIAHRSADVRGVNPVVFVFKPFAADDFTKCSINLRSNPGLGFVSNVAAWEPLDHLCAVEPLLLPGVEVSNEPTIAADGLATVQVRVVNKETAETLSAHCDLFLEATGGYLPLQRIRVSDGLGSFKVKALGLEAGQKFKVKVGFRLMTGLADASFEVV